MSSILVLIYTVNRIAGVTCLVVSPMERERGGSSKVSEAVLVLN